MIRSMLRSLCDVWALILLGLLAVLIVALYVDEADAARRDRPTTLHLERGEVARVVTHSPVVCVFVANRTVVDSQPRQVTRVVARPCPPSVEPDTILRPPGAT